MAALSPKNPDIISPSQLMEIAEAHWTILFVTSFGVELRPHNHDIVLEYLKLAEGVTKIAARDSRAWYSLSAPCTVEVSKTIAARGVVCAADTDEEEPGVLFQFGEGVIYRLKNTLEGFEYQQQEGQMFSSLLRFRYDVLLKNQLFFKL